MATCLPALSTAEYLLFDHCCQQATAALPNAFILSVQRVTPKFCASAHQPVFESRFNLPMLHPHHQSQPSFKTKHACRECPAVRAWVSCKRCLSPWGRGSSCTRWVAGPSCRRHPCPSEHVRLHGRSNHARQCCPQDVRRFHPAENLSTRDTPQCLFTLRVTGQQVKAQHSDAEHGEMAEQKEPGGCLTSVDQVSANLDNRHDSLLLAACTNHSARKSAETDVQHDVALQCKLHWHMPAKPLTPTAAESYYAVT